MMSRRCGRKKDARKRFITSLSDRNIVILSFGSSFHFLSLYSSPICTCPSSARSLAHSQYSASSASHPLSFPLALMPRHRPPRPTERARDALQNLVPSGIGSVRDVDAGIYVTMCVFFPFGLPDNSF